MRPSTQRQPAHVGFVNGALRHLREARLLAAAGHALIVDRRWWPATRAGLQSLRYRHDRTAPAVARGTGPPASHRFERGRGRPSASPQGQSARRVACALAAFAIDGFAVLPQGTTELVSRIGRAGLAVLLLLQTSSAGWHMLTHRTAACSSSAGKPIAGASLLVCERAEGKLASAYGGQNACGACQAARDLRQGGLAAVAAVSQLAPFRAELLFATTGTSCAGASGWKETRAPPSAV